MIIYLTKQTVERYKVKLPEDLTPPMKVLAQSIIEKESGNNICEWGGKLFYFDHRKCIQIVNFASKLTLFLVDMKIDDLPNIGDYIAKYLLDMYSADEKMVYALERLFNEHPLMCFSKLKDRSIIATLNTTQTRFAEDGYRFYDFIRDGILHTREMNYKVNFDWLFSMKTNGRVEYFYAGEKFREIVLEKYKI